MASAYRSPYGRGITPPIISEPSPKKKHRALIVTIIIVIIIIIIIIIVIFFVTRKSTPAATTGTSTGTKCTASSQCLAPNKVCNLTTGNCVVCLANGDCAAPNPYCSNNACVQCLADNNCTAPAVCKSGTCCDLTPPVITSLAANLTTSSRITGAYTFSQQSFNTTAIVTVYDVNNVPLYTQAPNNALGTILVTETETGSVLFPNTTYGVSVLIKNTTCGSTANSPIVQVTTVACGNEPGAMVDTGILLTQATVTTNLSTANNSPGISISVNYPSNPGQSNNAPVLSDIESGNATFGMIVYTISGLEPNLAPMVVRGLKAQNFVVINPPHYAFILASPWQGITPVDGTTYYFRIWFEACPNCTGCNTPGCTSGVPTCSGAGQPLLCPTSTTFICSDLSTPSCSGTGTVDCTIGCNKPGCISPLNEENSVVATN